MTTELFVKLVLSLISVLSVLITAYGIPMLKSHITAEKMDQLTYYVTVAVRCAEQIYTPEQWKQKKQWVLDYVKKIGDKLHITLTDEDLDIMIEGIVNEIKHDHEYQAEETR